MSKPAPTAADYERADRAVEAAEIFARQLPGFPERVKTSSHGLPVEHEGRPSWTVMVEARDYTAAARVRVVEHGEPGPGSAMVAELVERYTHSIGDADDAGEDYYPSFAAATAAAEARTRKHRSTAFIWTLDNPLTPAALVFDGTVYKPA